MAEKILHYEMKDPLELNLSYMPFVNDGGLFIPTKEMYASGDEIEVSLQFADKKTLAIKGRVIWITPFNALHHVLPGVGVQLIGDQAANVRQTIEANLVTGMEIGGYTCGITEPMGREKSVV